MTERENYDLQDFNRYEDLLWYEMVIRIKKEIKKNSNIPFDQELINNTISFFALKSQQILNNEKKHTSFNNLLNECLDEALILKNNIKGGTF